MVKVRIAPLSIMRMGLTFFIKVVQAVDDNEGAWVQSLKRAKSTLTELPRQMTKDKDGGGSGFGTSSARGVEISDLRPSSLVNSLK